jgi:hypothetical protein
MSNEKRCSEPVSRILCPFASPFASFEASGSLRATIIPLVPALLTGSSNLPGSAIGPIEMLPYLVLLRAGFGLPRLLPAARWALTLPFHPYPSTHLPDLSIRKVRSGRYLFCATFRRVAPPGCYPAHCPAEFGLSSPAATSSASPLRAMAIRFSTAAITRLTAFNLKS